MTQTTREQMLESARNLFAERGFYGVSIANIADQHGLTKQALLHHFGAKEKLYGEVLKEIAVELDTLVNAAQSVSDVPSAQLKELFQRMVSKTQDNVIRTRLLMREILDNKHRAETAGAWYLKPFLVRLVDIVKAIEGWSQATDAQARALIFQLLGAVNYYGVSGPTQQGIYGKAGAKALQREFPSQLEAMIEAALKNPPEKRRR